MYLCVSLFLSFFHNHVKLLCDVTWYYVPVRFDGYGNVNIRATYAFVLLSFKPLL